MVFTPIPNIGRNVSDSRVMTNSMHYDGRYQSPRAPLSRNEELDALAPPPAQGPLEHLMEHRALAIAVAAVLVLALAGAAAFAIVQFGVGGRTAPRASATIGRETQAEQVAAEPARETPAEQIPQEAPSDQIGQEAPAAAPEQAAAPQSVPEQAAAPQSAPEQAGAPSSEPPQAQGSAQSPQPVEPAVAALPDNAAEPGAAQPGPSPRVDSAPQTETVPQAGAAEQAGETAPREAGSLQPGASDSAVAAPAAVQNAEFFAIDLGAGSSFSELSQRFDEIAQLNQEVPFERLEPRATVEQDGKGLVAHLRVGPFSTPEAAQQACQQLALPAGVECTVSMFEGGRINRR